MLNDILKQLNLSRSVQIQFGASRAKTTKRSVALNNETMSALAEELSFGRRLQEYRGDKTKPVLDRSYTYAWVRCLNIALTMSDVCHQRDSGGHVPKSNRQH